MFEFLKLSKSYMNYPNCGRFYFWTRFPKAFIIYAWLGIKWRFNLFK